jgi:hypothetical protein
MFKNGGDALKEQAEGIDDNMLATEESIEASREFEVILDNLGDTATGLGRKFATKLLPPLNDVLSALDKYVAATMENIDVSKVYYQLIDRGLITEEERMITVRRWHIGLLIAESNEIMAKLVEKVWKNTRWLIRRKNASSSCMMT